MRISQLGRKYFSTLVIVDHHAYKFNRITLKIINAATSLNQPVSLLVASDNAEQIVKQIQEQVQHEKVKNIIVAEHEAFKNPQADTLSSLVRQLIEKNKYTAVVGSTTTRTKDFLPRVAATYGSQAVTDIIEVISEKQFKRPVYAGNALATVETQDEIKFLTFRPTNFEEIQSSGQSPVVEKFEYKLEKQSIKHIKDDLQQNDRPDLASAKIVVAGGRGLQSKENFKILEDLAIALGNAAVGASRAAVDAGYVNNDLQIGQTGKVVAPNIYFAVGISGAIQHLAGMKDSKVIVAINKDAEATMIQVADYSLIGDLFKIVPELTQKLKASQQ